MGTIHPAVLAKNRDREASKETRAKRDTSQTAPSR